MADGRPRKLTIKVSADDIRDGLKNGYSLDTPLSLGILRRLKPGHRVFTTSWEYTVYNVVGRVVDVGRYISEGKDVKEWFDRYNRGDEVDPFHFSVMGGVIGPGETPWLTR